MNKEIITTKVRLRSTHDPVQNYALRIGAKRGKRMSLPEAYELIVKAGLKVLKKNNFFRIFFLTTIE